MKNSIEEKIQKLQEQKQDLSNMFIENNNGSITQMSTAELLIYLNKEKGDQRRSIFKSPFLM